MIFSYAIVQCVCFVCEVGLQLSKECGPGFLIQEEAMLPIDTANSKVVEMVSALANSKVCRCKMYAEQSKCKVRDLSKMMRTTTRREVPRRRVSKKKKLTGQKNLPDRWYVEPQTPKKCQNSSPMQIISMKPYVWHAHGRSPTWATSFQSSSDRRHSTLIGSGR